MSQDVFLFPGTVADNVKLGNTTIDDAAVDGALRRVGAERVLARRGAGSGAEIAERGANFSAGGQQLVAVARAPARQLEGLVRDEAAAHRDRGAPARGEAGPAGLGSMVPLGGSLAAPLVGT